MTNYLNELSTWCSQSWNQFWFKRSDSHAVSMMRIFVGGIALLYALSFTSELGIWFSDGGILPIARTNRLTGAADPGVSVYYWSLFSFATSNWQLYLLHAIGIVSISLFAAGLKTRVTAVVATVFVISYALRAPMFMGLVESLLCPLMIYLCLAPSGEYFSVDAWLQSKSSKDAPKPSLAAHVITRLIQVHVCMLYLMLSFAKLEHLVWWNGDAMWWILARPEGRLLDLTFLSSSPKLVYAWTHFVILFQCLFAVLIWFRPLRPLLAGVAAIHWILLGLATGFWEFSLLMIGLTMAFEPWNYQSNSVNSTVKQTESVKA